MGLKPLTEADDLGELEEDGCPMALWYQAFLWLEDLPIDVPTIKLFSEEGVDLLLQYRNGELSYAYARHPETWLSADALVEPPV